MYKLIAFLTAFFFFFGLQVQAEEIDYNTKINEYKSELEQIRKDMKNTDDKQEKIVFNKRKSDLINKIKAYELVIDDKKTTVKAINYESTSLYKDVVVSDLDVVNVGTKWIGKSKYVFGGGRNHFDVSIGNFDCSSFVFWAYNEVGIQLGEMTSVTTDTLKHLGTAVHEDEMQPGDLVFFDTYKIDGHVGIYAGNGKFIGAQSSTGVAFADMTTGYWKDKFNGRVKRILN